MGSSRTCCVVSGSVCNGWLQVHVPASCCNRGVCKQTCWSPSMRLQPFGRDHARSGSPVVPQGPPGGRNRLCCRARWGRPRQPWLYTLGRLHVVRIEVILHPTLGKEAEVREGGAESLRYTGHLQLPTISGGVAVFQGRAGG